MPRKTKNSDKTRAGLVINWIQTRLVVPEGPDIGKPVRLRDWQVKEIRRIYNNPHGTRRAILSFGRKNGKTSLAAMLVLVHLCGPEAKSRPNSSLYSAAQSRDQASLIFNFCAKMVRMSADLAGVLTVRDTRKEILFKAMGITYRALSAEAATTYGLSPSLIVHDELGQVRGPRSELYEALETATGSAIEPLSIVISTQAPTNADLFNVLIDDALAGHDPRVIVSLYTADDKLDAFGEEAIKAANPAYGDFQNAREVLSMAADAKRMPAREAQYRNLILNQRVEAESPFVTRAVWEACGGDVMPIDDCEVYGGLDLSAVNDLTACVMVGRIGKVWHCHPTFWLPHDGLAERSRNDRVPYDMWARDGALVTIPGRTIDMGYVAEWLREQFDRYDIAKIGFDRWNFNLLRSHLLRVGFTEDKIKRHFVEAGQGFRWMAAALRSFEQKILDEQLAHGNHPVLAMCARNSVVDVDPAANRKLAKNRSTGRIDGMVALTMAFGVMTEPLEAPAEPKRYHAFVLDW